MGVNNEALLGVAAILFALLAYGWALWIRHRFRAERARRDRSA